MAGTLPDAWFDTVGKQILSDFFRTVDRVYTAGIKAGLKPKVNVDELFRAYRNDPSTVITEERAKTILWMFGKGVSVRKIAEWVGIQEKSVSDFLKAGGKDVKKRNDPHRAIRLKIHDVIELHCVPCTAVTGLQDVKRNAICYACEIGQELQRMGKPLMTVSPERRRRSVGEGTIEPKKEERKPMVAQPTSTDRRRKDRPACGMTKRDLLKGIADGETLASIEKAWSMKYNTIHDWVKKWGLKGITPGQASDLLAAMETEQHAEEKDSGPETDEQIPDQLQPEEGSGEGALEAAPDIWVEKVGNDLSAIVAKQSAEIDQLQAEVERWRCIAMAAEAEKQLSKPSPEPKPITLAIHIPTFQTGRTVPDLRQAATEVINGLHMVANLVRQQLIALEVEDPDAALIRFFTKLQVERVTADGENGS